MYLNKKEQHQIIEAIRLAEQTTSGEIRVHIEGYCEDANPLDRAAWLFTQLGMEHTSLRNGVLIYLSVKDHKLSIIGDSGINSKVPDNYWEHILNQMIVKLKRGKIVDAITDGIANIGNQLKTLFPYQTDDINELPNAISFGD